MTSPTPNPLLPSSSSSTPPTRFEQELEFVSLLASPAYLVFLASSKTLTQPAFVAYLAYLHAYWAREPYIRYLAYPGPTLRALELLQSEDFRRDVLRPEVGARLQGAMLEGARRR